MVTTDCISEECQKDHDGVKANPDCQVLYSAGTLTEILGLNSFDAIAFLIHFNDGHAMTIKEMAANFYVIDESKQNDGSDKVALIDCQAKRGGQVQCDEPKFKINRHVTTPDASMLVRLTYRQSAHNASTY